MTMLSGGKSTLAFLFNGATDFNFHSASFVLDVNNDTNDSSIIKIHNVVRLEIPLNFTAINSDMIEFRW